MVIIIGGCIFFWSLALYYYLLWKKGYGATKGFGDIFIGKLVKQNQATNDEKKYLLFIVLIVTSLPLFLFLGWSFYFF